MNETSAHGRPVAAMVHAEFTCGRCGGPHVVLALAKLSDNGRIVGPVEKLAQENICNACRRVDDNQQRAQRQALAQQKKWAEGRAGRLVK